MLPIAVNTENKFKHSLLPVALLLIFVFTVVRMVAQDKSGSSTMSIRAQVKPDKPWIEYPTRILKNLPLFDTILVDPSPCRYGGVPQVKAKATGYFSIQKVDDRWWFIDPDGCRFYTKAVVSVSIGKSKTAESAMKRLYTSKKNWADSTLHLLKIYGFNSTGAWSDSEVTQNASPRMPYTLMCNFMSSYGKKRGGTYQQPGHTGYPNDCIFIFDPEFASFCDSYAQRLARYRDDPFLIGYFTDNELPFPDDALDRFLSLDSTEAGYRFARTWIQEQRGSTNGNANPSENERKQFLALIAEKYFSITSASLRRVDPHHLVLGSRFHAKVIKQEEVFRAAGKSLDCISINYYNTWTPDSALMNQWVLWSGKPFIITEWYVKGADAGLSNSSGAGWIVPTQKDRGLFYQNFTLALLRNKGCLGWHWFRYMDNDPAAKGVDPSNVDGNKGIVSTNLVPYYPLVECMKELNDRVYHLIDFFDRKETR